MPHDTITLNPSEIYTYKPRTAEELKMEKERQMKDQLNGKSNKRNRTRGRHAANKTDLDKQGRRDRMRQQMISDRNNAMLKARVAEKVKKLKESKEVSGLDSEIMARIPQLVQSRIERTIQREGQAKQGRSSAEDRPHARDD